MILLNERLPQGGLKNVLTKLIKTFVGLFIHSFIGAQTVIDVFKKQLCVNADQRPDDH